MLSAIAAVMARRSPLERAPEPEGMLTLRPESYPGTPRPRRRRWRPVEAVAAAQGERSARSRRGKTSLSRGAAG